MVQINLLPDVKRDYLKSQQMKHMFIVISVVASLASLGLLALMFVYVQIVQPAHKTALQHDIDANISQIKKQANASKIITVQGALEQLPGLQDKKQITSNTFAYLTSFTPRTVTYDEVTLDVASSTMTLSGTTTSTEQTNILANNLKSAKFSYKQNDQTQTVTPFSAVVFTSLNRNEQAQDGKNVSFELTLQFDPVLFSQAISEQSLKVNASSEQLVNPTDKPFSDSTTSTGAAQ